ncbi:MurR/RpiR family transcriptional regulator [Anaerococcus sp. AGMB00486]|uniref:MurR/RpiR family transcriptional regulator n=2 Tax=Anaerococcus TaxID=165779 RepID=A0ABX2N959_9FIRM|nr:MULTISPECIES: MurR/RpiR family transcriptional regulator [Anaerococcus]MSS77569.1 MurR/RpiR family transcriptional regulator [Anaerococcus porci]NVF11241.1 MurR/RpiR family transcriptional regulator [Anaerococcus faecalis]
MEYLIRIKDKKENFTQKDKLIADYILKNKDKIINESSIDLAKNTKTSQSAVTRFVKKIGYKSFVDMKVSIAKSFESKNEYIEDEIKKDDKISEIIDKSRANIQKTLEKTYAIIDEKNIEKAGNLINMASRIYLCGVAGSGLICEDFYYKLLRAGANVFYEKDAHTNLSAISHIKKGDILIAISYNAKTKEVLEAVKFAKENNARVIAITKSEKSKIKDLSDIILKIPSSEKEIRYGAITSRFSSFIITDILFFTYIAKNYENVNESLKISKDLTDKLK